MIESKMHGMKNIKSEYKAAILNLDFNLYDKIISFTVLHILQIQMF
jgi:hypothetical protein